MAKTDAPKQHLDSSGPSKDGFSVTPSDGSDLSERARSLFIGVGGDVKVDTVMGTTLTFKNVGGGQILPIAVDKVYSTDTTATDIVALL